MVMTPVSYEETAKKFAHAVFRLRNETGNHGITQMTLAERADMDQEAIQDVECAVRMPSIHTARKIAKGFGMSLAELMKEAEL